jgi:hypothetical protein
MKRLAGDPQLRIDLVQSGRTRLADFSPEKEFGGLLEAIKVIVTKTARWRRSGYHAVDGLIEPLAIFGLPLCSTPQELSFATRPLGVARTLEFWCSGECLAIIPVAAHGETKGQLLLPNGARVITLRVPDATRLSTADARTHGVLLERLFTTNPEGTITDLLRSPAS